MKHFLLFIFLLSGGLVFGQSKLPVIKATSKKVAINDGGFLDKNAWSLSPKTRPDVYTADRARAAKWVTFYTDIDSIRVKIKPGTRYNFIILLNGKDSCYTQIASAIPPEDKLKNNIVTNDTIPFTLSAHNAIHVKAIMNDVDTLNLHFDLSSFDFHFTRDAILKKTKLLPNQADVLAGKAKPDYNNMSKALKLQIGGMIWRNQEILPTNITADDMDGRFGWNLFEGKQVEVNYDEKVLVIHTKLQRSLKKGYVKSKIGFTHSFAYASGSFEIGGKSYTGNFLMDTGSEQAAILDSGWVAKNNFPTDLKLIKSSTISDPRGVKYEMKIVEAPLFRINGFAQTHVPAIILSGRNPMGFEINYLGNGLLKHFNMILDFKNDYLYLKPNKLST
ncbi:hypothetical protein SNE26_22710 [Mucilaginibacter sp. cycad4]|uniref:hypothetical protein n=1 Tax=Mucilaginibacter sp. cycad4 TaxID=3342096 RepID=UPI002AAA6C9E|nr:hypothetical protein [Mucilaginibacter gossypii]WPU98830.1 hypothetical protein SNE26_22710 [Mucilaginibacter gossypii]